MPAMVAPSRERRYPPGALSGAVGAAHRLHCDARPKGAWLNSLRSLRSLHSNSRHESVHEARCARRPPACASRRPTGRTCRVPPPATTTVGCSRFVEENQRVRKGVGGQTAARLCAADNKVAVKGHVCEANVSRNQKRRACGRARQRASTTDSWRLFERSEQSERSELSHGPRARASQGTLAQRGQADGVPTAARPHLRLPHPKQAVHPFDQ